MYIAEGKGTDSLKFLNSTQLNWLLAKTNTLNKFKLIITSKFVSDISSTPHALDFLEFAINFNVYIAMTPSPVFRLW
jgi:hypothetical protein